MTTPGEMAVSVDASTPPDWATVTTDFFCPLCEYNLRGLVEPRCPECGYQFIWSEIFKAEKLHPFLFEHHPENNLKSFRRTYLASLRPMQFWKKLLPTHVPVVKRLILYWTILVIPLILATAAALALSYFQDKTSTLNYRAAEVSSINRYSPPDFRQQTIAKYGSIEKYVESRFPLPSIFRVIQRNWLVERLLVPEAGGVLLWPWLTIATLLLFRESLAQARINPVHVMRCVIYSASIILPLGPVAIASSCIAPMVLSSRTWLITIPPSMNLILLTGWLITMLALMIAYYRYLRFPHSIATLLASQAIVGLAMFKMYLMYLGY